MSVDFRAQIADQLGIIESSCDRYDAGDARAGISIAASLRILFHQTGNSTSLLTRLKASDVQLLSTCDTAESRHHFFPAMTNIVVDPPSQRLEFVPKLQVDYERLVAFNKWWFTEAVYVSRADRIRITRKDLVLGAAHEDGGAHAAEELEPRYEKVLEGLGWSMTVNPDSEPSQDVSCKHGHLAALRQMGYEVLHSPDLLSLATNA